MGGSEAGSVFRWPFKWAGMAALVSHGLGEFPTGAPFRRPLAPAALGLAKAGEQGSDLRAGE